MTWASPWRGDKPRGGLEVATRRGGVHDALWLDTELLEEDDRGPAGLGWWAAVR